VAPGVTDLELLFDSGRDLSQPVCAGVFAGGELKAAALFGTLPETASPRDFGLIRPGDGVIQWFVCRDPSSGTELLDHCRSQLPARTFVCPESSGFSPFSVFRTGMLPVSFGEENVVMLTNGLTVPASEAWGPQERLWFRTEIRADLPGLELPPGLTAVRDTTGTLTSSLRILDGADLAGECRISPAMLLGRPCPGHVYIGWLGVGEHYRNGGLGGRLLVEQLRWARENGATVGVLTTHSGRPAHRLYRRLGFAGVGAARTYCTG
jgi:GNAT superfamily N-acetyltransferase